MQFRLSGLCFCSFDMFLFLFPFPFLFCTWHGMIMYRTACKRVPMLMLMPMLINHLPAHFRPSLFPPSSPLPALTPPRPCLCTVQYSTVHLTHHPSPHFTLHFTTQNPESRTCPVSLARRVGLDGSNYSCGCGCARILLPRYTSFIQS